MSAKSWNGIETGFPRTGSAQQKLTHVLKIVSEFSATEVWPGWRYRLDEDHIELCANFSGVSDAVDPDGRESIIHCGAALFRSKLALKCFGCLGPVEVFPDLGNPELVARIHCGGGRGQDEREFKLFEAMVGNPGDSSARSQHPVCGTVSKSLISAAVNEPAWLEFSEGESSRKLLLAFAQAHALVGTNDRVAKNSSTKETTGQLNFWPGPSDGKAGTDPGHSQAALAVLKSKTDDKHGWLATGQARARAQLQARACGMSLYFFDQAFRERSSRQQLRTAIGRKGFVQAIVGCGSGMTGAEFPLLKGLNTHSALQDQTHPPRRRWFHGMLGLWRKGDHHARTERVPDTTKGTEHRRHSSAA
jgi:hypothetical protein